MEINRLESIFAESVVDRLLERGDVKFLVLDSLNRGAKHGYQIIKDISTRFRGLYTPSPGVIYPTLEALEDEGMIISKVAASGSRRKSFAITKKGSAFLKRNRAHLNGVVARFSACLKASGSKEFRHIQRDAADIMHCIIGVMNDARGGMTPKVKRKLAVIESLLGEFRERLEIICEE